MRIEKIQPRSTRQTVEFDTGDVLVIANDVASDFGLYRGKELSDDEFARLKNEQELYDALTAAHHFLGYRARSEREVREKLRQKKFTAATIERAMGKLQEGNYLDDDLFAVKFVHDSLLKKPVGQVRLKQELRRKGITDRAIDGAIADQFDAGAEYDAAMRLAERRVKKNSEEPLAKQKYSLRQYLQSRGFSRETLDAVIKNVFEQGGGGDQ